MRAARTSQRVAGTLRARSLQPWPRGGRRWWSQAEGGAGCKSCAGPIRGRAPGGRRTVVVRFGEAGASASKAIEVVLRTRRRKSAMHVEAQEEVGLGS